jgi:uncharacterized protein
MTEWPTHGNTVDTAGSGQSAWLLRVYLLAGDRFEGEPLAEAILLAARKAGIQGATVLPGIAGFGKSGLHGELEVSLHDPLRQPVVVEMAAIEQRVQDFLPELQRLNTNRRLTTVERLSVLSYHSGTQKAKGEMDPGAKPAT